jgi:hypothetical protein
MRNKPPKEASADSHGALQLGCPFTIVQSQEWGPGLMHFYLAIDGYIPLRRMLYLTKWQSLNQSVMSAISYQHS